MQELKRIINYKRIILLLIAVTVNVVFFLYDNKPVMDEDIINKENVALNRTNLVRRDDNALTLCIEAKEIKNFPIAFGYLLHIERHGIACHAATRLAD